VRRVLPLSLSFLFIERGVLKSSVSFSPQQLGFFPNGERLSSPASGLFLFLSRRKERSLFIHFPIR